MTKRTRTPKTGEIRNMRIPLRVSESELKLIDDLRNKRNKYGDQVSSRTDTIVACVKFATGKMDIVQQIDLQKAIDEFKSEQ